MEYAGAALFSCCCCCICSFSCCCCCICSLSCCCCIFLFLLLLLLLLSFFSSCCCCCSFLFVLLLLHAYSCSSCLFTVYEVCVLISFYRFHFIYNLFCCFVCLCVCFSALLRCTYTSVSSFHTKCSSGGPLRTQRIKRLSFC